MDELNQIFFYVIQNGIIGIVAGSFIIGLSYVKLKNNLSFKIIAMVISFVAFSADVVVLLTSVQILAPNLYVNALLIALSTGTIFLGVVSYYFYLQLIKPLNKISNDAKNLAKGNLEIKIIKSNRSDEIGILTNSLSDLFDKLNVQGMVENISSSIELLNDLANDLASSSEEINASIEEITSTIQEITSRATKQNNLVARILDSGSNLQNEFRSNSISLRQTSKLIEGINNKINLLALNASIEAARAGEYGKGFAIVAENIRMLADETKDSLDRSNTIIIDLESKINSNIKNILNEINEISTESNYVTIGTEEIFSSIEVVSSSIQELSAKSIELAQISKKLSTITENF